MKLSIRWIAACCLLALACLALAHRADAQLPSSPRRFVDFLDTRCYTIPNQPSLNVALRLDHLNPVLQNAGLPFEQVTLGAPQKLCVPVTKNGQTAPSDTLPFITYVDWKCYAISGPSVNFPLQLTQLNPVIASLFGPTVAVTLLAPQQLCVPVIKNSSNPPSNVQQLVQWTSSATASRPHSTPPRTSLLPTSTRCSPACRRRSRRSVRRRPSSASR
jgi:hypothetical protein